MQIRATQSFLRQAKKNFKKNPNIRTNFQQVIDKLTDNPFEPSLKTHKLTGELKDFWSCSITYKIRMTFVIIDDIIELIDIGAHDEVY